MVAHAMGEAAQAVDAQVVLALGDNFYFTGVSGVEDPLWSSVWQVGRRERTHAFIPLGPLPHTRLLSCLPQCAGRCAGQGAAHAARALLTQRP